MSAIVDIEPLMRGLHEEIQMGGETYSTQSVYKMIENETSKVEVFTKADMVAILTEIQLEIEKQCKIPNNNASAYDWNNGVYSCYKVVQQKIDKLKEVEE